MKNLQVWIKLTITFSILILFTLFTGFQGWKATQRIALLSDKLEKIDNILVYLLDARRYEKSYIMVRDTYNVNRLHSQIKILKENALEFKLITENEEERKEIENILIQANEYQQNFDAYVTLAEKEKPMLAAIETSNDKIKTYTANFTNNINAVKLFMLFTEARMFEKNFIQTKDSVAYNQCLTYIDQALSVAKNANMPESFNNIDTYKKTFHSFYENSLEKE